MTQADQTQMTNPPKSTTKMVASQNPKKVKLKILRDTADPRSEDKMTPAILPGGSVVEVDVKTAKELLNRKYRGMYEFSGERQSEERVGTIRVAERYVEPLPEVAEELE